MLVSRSPLRICLSGGGTDLPSFYEYFGLGRTISLAINKYSYVLANTHFGEDHIIKYSQYETVKNFTDISHPIIKEVLIRYREDKIKMELLSASDVQAGTGLGSSGAFTVNLIHLMRSLNGQSIDLEAILAEACEIEIEVLKNGSGKQDQYISGLGGLQELTFLADGFVENRPLPIVPDQVDRFVSKLVMVFTGVTRKAELILKEQEVATVNRDPEMLERLKTVFAQNEIVKSLLCSGSFDDYADILNEHWAEKRSRSSGMSVEAIDDLIAFGLDAGALGAKLVGAGGGGFVLFYTNERREFIDRLNKIPLKVLDFQADYTGVGLI